MAAPMTPDISVEAVRAFVRRHQDDEAILKAALVTKDAHLGIVHDVYEALWKRLDASLKDRHDDLKFERKGDPLKDQYAGVGWKKTDWPEPVRVLVEFDRPGYRTSSFGIYAPCAARAGELNAGEKTAPESVYERIQTLAPEHGFDTRGSAVRWPVSAGLFADSADSQTVLKAAGLQPHGGEDLSDWLAERLFRLCALVDKAIG